MVDNQVFGWDDTGYVADDTAFDVLPEGEYDFEVRDVKYDRYNKQNQASSIPDNCPFANVQIWCTNDKAKGMAFERLYLYSGGMGRISSFFKAIGLLPADAPANAPMPAPFKQMFDQAVTRTGRCKLTIRTYKGNNGTDQKSNNVRFLAPEPKSQPVAQQPQQQAWGAGSGTTGGWGGSWGQQ